MKKALLSFFLIISTIIVFLSTVDLEPYLTPKIALEPLADQQVDKKTEIELEVTTQEMSETEEVSANKENVVEINTENENRRDLETYLPSLTHFFPSNLETDGLKRTQNKEKPKELPSEPTVKEVETSVVKNTVPSYLGNLEITILAKGEYPYSILLDTFNEKISAEEAISHYQEQGILSHWVKVNIGANRIKYRLFTGAFQSWKTARQYIDKNNLATKLVKPTIYSARIGIYRDEELLNIAFKEVKNTGVIPYIIGTEKGDYYLYVGAFYTFIGATTQCEDLIAQSLTCKPVKRSTLPDQ